MIFAKSLSLQPDKLIGNLAHLTVQARKLADAFETPNKPLIDRIYREHSVPEEVPQQWIAHDDDACVLTDRHRSASQRDHGSTELAEPSERAVEIAVNDHPEQFLLAVGIERDDVVGVGLFEHVTHARLQSRALTKVEGMLDDDGTRLVYTFDVQGERTGIATLLRQLADHGIDFKDLHSSESSLEDIFVSLVRGAA